MAFSSPRWRWLALAVGAALVVVLAVSVWLALELRPAATRLVGVPERFTVKPGLTLRRVAQELDGAGIIRSQLALRIAARLTRQERIVAGTYDVSPMDRPRELLRRLVRGETAEVRVMLIEGWTSDQMGQALAQALILPANTLSVAARRPPSELLPAQTFDFLVDRPAEAGLEGYLFPDTYQFLRYSQPSEVVLKMLENFGRRVTPTIRARIMANGHTLFEAVTLASIVEREVATTDDRRKVADLFWRRLSKRMPLESDATVNFVTGKGRAAPSFEDTRVDSPYNTYLHPGLPPGPIGNPGLASIEAVAEPEPNEYFYFLSDKEGTTHFAKTYEEHLANKAKYLK